MLVIAMLPQFETTPLTVCGPPRIAGAHSFVTVRHGFTQMLHDTVVWLVTEAFGPPMIVMSVPRTVTVFAALPAQISAKVGRKPPWKPTACPGSSVNGWISGRNGGVEENNCAVRLSTTVTLVNRISPQLVT